jgi:hypothetical protein
MGNQQLEDKICCAIQRGLCRFSEIQCYCGVEPHRFREIDRALQRLRKRGEIAFKAGRWHNARPMPAEETGS